MHFIGYKNVPLFFNHLQLYISSNGKPVFSSSQWRIPAILNPRFYFIIHGKMNALKILNSERSKNRRVPNSSASDTRNFISHLTIHFNEQFHHYKWLVNDNVTRIYFLDKVKKTMDQGKSKFFIDRVRKLIHRWEKCIAVNNNYVEK